MQLSGKAITARQRMLLCLMAGSPGLQVSCVTVGVPPVPSQAVRDHLGSVAVVPAQYAPQTEFLISWRHKEGATGKQAALTAAGATAATAAEIESAISTAVAGLDVQSALAGRLAKLVAADPRA
jgi:hypothetical protein